MNNQGGAFLYVYLPSLYGCTHKCDLGAPGHQQIAELRHSPQQGAVICQSITVKALFMGILLLLVWSHLFLREWKRTAFSQYAVSIGMSKFLHVTHKLHYVLHWYQSFVFCIFEGGGSKLWLFRVHFYGTLLPLPTTFSGHFITLLCTPFSCQYSKNSFNFISSLQWLLKYCWPQSATGTVAPPETRSKFPTKSICAIAQYYINITSFLSVPLHEE